MIDHTNTQREPLYYIKLKTGDELLARAVYDPETHNFVVEFPLEIDYVTTPSGMHAMALNLWVNPNVTMGQAFTVKEDNVITIDNATKGMEDMYIATWKHIEHTMHIEKAITDVQEKAVGANIATTHEGSMMIH